jgi:hypothetical protein
MIPQFISLLCIWCVICVYWAIYVGGLAYALRICNLEHFAHSNMVTRLSMVAWACSWVPYIHRGLHLRSLASVLLHVSASPHSGKVYPLVPPMHS